MDPNYSSLVAQQLVESLGAEQCTLRIIEGNVLRLVAAYGVDIGQREGQIPLLGTLAGEAAAKDEVIYIPNICEDERYKMSSHAQNGQAKSVLAIPIKFGGKLIGVAQVYASAPFDEKQIAKAENLVQFAGMAFYCEQSLMMNRFALIELARAIVKDTNLEEIFKHVVEQIVKTLGVERCAIYRIFTKENKEQWCKIIAGLPLNEHGVGLQEIIEDHPDIKSVVDGGEAIIISSPWQDKLTAHFRKIVESKRINQIYYAPILYNLKVIGVVVVDANGERKGFTFEENIFLKEIFELLTVILERDSNVHQEIRHEVITSAVVFSGWSRIAKKALESNDISKALEHVIKAQAGVAKLEEAIPRVMFQN